MIRNVVQSVSVLTGFTWSTNAVRNIWREDDITSKTANGAIAAREGYEAYTGLRALERAGHCKNLHGHVHEVMFCDKFNCNPANILEGKQAILSKSTSAPVHDVVVMKGGHFAGGFQLKDTVSNSGVSKTLRQINSGKYNHTTILGTEETVDRLGDQALQKVHSSGISSQTTTRIADKALGRMPSASALGLAARSGGMFGAGIGAGVELISSLSDVCDGRKTLDEAAIDVGAAAVKGGITGAGSAAAGTFVSGATGAAVSTFAATGVGAAMASTALGATALAAAPLVVGFGAACAIGGLISSIFDD